MVILKVVSFFLIAESILVLASPTNLGIIGGKNASIQDHPWMVSMVEKNADMIGCGGFLISSTWIVTAGHCIEEGELVYARAGSSSLSSGGMVVSIAEKILHSEYNHTTLDNDIGVIRLEIPVTGDNIQPIDLPDPDTVVPDGEMLNIAGWGTMNGTYPVMPDALQEVNIPAVSTERCRAYYYVPYSPITDNMICVGYMGEGGKGPCYGDSGSALTWNGIPVGIMSWMNECASYRFPTVFTKVANYVGWIKNVTGI